jgi:hypothetical protein
MKNIKNFYQYINENMEIDTKYKIGLDGFIEQEFPWECPDCSYEMNAKDIIGFGSYPIGGYRNSLKPNCDIGVGFECPKCFTKSVFHGNESVYKLFLDVNKY